MKKLSLCALLCGASFAVFGTVIVLRFASETQPFALFFSLAWDFAMVGLGLTCVLQDSCVQRARMTWTKFCVPASLIIAAVAVSGLRSLPMDDVTGHRTVFVLLTAGFGVVFSVWQFFASRSSVAATWHAEPAAPVLPAR
jgi:hypothetical protein